MPKYTYIFLDANFILIPALFKLDIYKKIEELAPKPLKVLVVQAILDELEFKANLKGQKSRFAHDYQLAIQILQQNEYHIIEQARDLQKDQSVDDLLLEVIQKFILNLMGQSKADSKDFTVFLATTDKELRKKAKKYDIPVIYLRQKRDLAVDL